MIPATAWVPRGAARATPVKLGTEDPEMEDGLIDESTLAEEAKRAGEEDEAGENIGDDEDPVKRAQQAQNALNKLVIETYGLDKYDEEEDNAVEPIEGVMHHHDNAEDPNMQGGDDDSEEIDDLTIRPSDLLIISVANEEDYNHLDLYVYDEKEDNLYVHHDVILPESPLCVAWLDYNTQQAAERGNFVAVGSFEPGIEIYDLDVVDSLEPVTTLGGRLPEGESAGGKKKGKKKKSLYAALKEGSHLGPVMSLAWNPTHRNGLASGSADNTVKLWDLNTGACAATLNHYDDKVQAVRWHPTEATVVLAGTISGQISVLDVRSPTAIRSWKLRAGVEQVCWNPHAPQFFLASTEGGEVACFNAMQAGTVAWRLAAHNKEVTGLALNPQVPHFLATASVDKTLKFWDMSGAQPTLLCSKSPGIGKIFSLNFCPDSPYLLVAGGDHTQPLVIDSKGFAPVCARYGLPAPVGTEENDEAPAAADK